MLFTTPTHGRHRRSGGLSSARRAVAVASGATTLLAGAAIGLAGPASAASSSDLAALRQCESGGSYSTNTGNGYYGAYQFDRSTWRSVGGSGLPSNASASTQDALAGKLQARRGWSPWPACSRHLGLRGGGGGGGGTSVEPSSGAAFQQTRAVRADVGYGGTYLSSRLVGSTRSDVRAVQAKLSERGYGLAIDGVFGSQTRGAVMAFQGDHGLAVDGVVGPNTWGALFG